MFGLKYGILSVVPVIQQPTSVSKCRQCGSDLILISQKTQRLENSYSDTTTTVYRCSNEECQKDIDKNVMKRQEQLAIQEEAKKKRLLASQKPTKASAEA